MSVDDQSDVWRELREMKRKIARLESGSMLENSSITRGRMRFIGGTLRVDSGGTVEIVGTLDVEGDTTLDGTLNLDGTMTVRNGQIVIDGANPITLASDGSGGAAVMFDGGGSLASAGTSIVLRAGDGSLIGLGGASVLLQADEIDVGQLPPLPNNTPSKYVVVGDDGILYSASNNGGGDPGNPGTPGDNPGGYIYPVNPEAWTLGDDFAAHVARGSAEPGIDWWTSIGTPLWAPGDGTIVDVQTSYAGPTGAYVTLVTDAGDWFRFLHNQSIAVAVNDTVSQGDVIAYTGGSGFGSPSGYGPHTHVSFKVGYTGTWPGGSSLDDFLAYMA